MFAERLEVQRLGMAVPKQIGFTTTGVLSTTNISTPILTLFHQNQSMSDGDEPNFLVGLAEPKRNSNKVLLAGKMTYTPPIVLTFWDNSSRSFCHFCLLNALIPLYWHH